MGKLTIVRGLPGSGKSTFANQLGYFHVENDYFHHRNGKYQFTEENKLRSIDWCIDIVESAVEAGIDVVVSNTFVKRQYINAYKRLADIYNASFEVFCMKGSFDNKHDVPEDVKKSMEEEWEDWDGEMCIYPDSHTAKEGFEDYDNTAAKEQTV